MNEAVADHGLARLPSGAASAAGYDMLAENLAINRAVNHHRRIVDAGMQHAVPGDRAMSPLPQGQADAHS